MPEHPTGPAGTRPLRRRGVVAVVIAADGKYLVVRRGHLIAAPRMFCFPGGGIEAGETEMDAVRREFREELGGVFLPQRRIWRCQTAWDVDLAWWLGTLDPRGALRADPAEVESLHWFSSDELLRLPNMLESNHEFLRNVAAGRINIRATLGTLTARDRSCRD